MFSKEEIKDLVIAILVITFVFSYSYHNRNVLLALLDFPVFMIIAIVCFLSHELAHRYVATKFGCTAYYKIWPIPLAISLVVSLLTGYAIIAIGAVIIRPYRFGRWGYKQTHLSMPETGLIAWAGPVTNLALALTFRLFTGSLFFILSFVNAWLAFFNLLPIKPLDGSNVLKWNQFIWFISIVIAFLLMLTMM